MHVTAKADYAVRAVVELAAGSQDTPRKVDEVAQAQGIPVSFLENILTQLRSSGIVRSQRGPEGGYWLPPPPAGLKPASGIRGRGGTPRRVAAAGLDRAARQPPRSARARDRGRCGLRHPPQRDRRADARRRSLAHAL